MAKFPNARTHKDVARFFGVSVNTVKQSWAPNGMPGRSGAYPLDKIAQWRHERTLRSAGAVNADDGSKNYQEQLLKAQSVKESFVAKLKQVDYETAIGELIPVGQIAEFLDVQITTHNALLEQFGDRVLRALPRNVSRELKARVLRECNKLADDLRHTMADAVEAWERGDYAEADDQEGES